MANACASASPRLRKAAVPTAPPAPLWPPRSVWRRPRCISTLGATSREKTLHVTGDPAALGEKLARAVTARIIDGKAVAAALRAQARRQVAALPFRPGLAVVLVGDDPASAVYVRSKDRAANAVGHRGAHDPPAGRYVRGSADHPDRPAERRSGGGRHPGAASRCRRISPRRRSSRRSIRTRMWTASIR